MTLLPHIHVVFLRSRAKFFKILLCLLIISSTDLLFLTEIKSLTLEHYRKKHQQIMKLPVLLRSPLTSFLRSCAWRESCARLRMFVWRGAILSWESWGIRNDLRMHVLILETSEKERQTQSWRKVHDDQSGFLSAESLHKNIPIFAHTINSKLIFVSVGYLNKSYKTSHQLTINYQVSSRSVRSRLVRETDIKFWLSQENFSRRNFHGSK